MSAKNSKRGRYILSKVHKCTILAMCILFVFSISACSGEADHDDGKCDICGKKATYSSDSEEYCDKHSLDAAVWYLKQGNDD